MSKAPTLEAKTGHAAQPRGLLIGAALTVAALAWLATLVPGALLVAHAETWQGRLAGLLAFVVLAALVAGARARFWPQASSLRVARRLGVVAFAGIALLIVAAPSGRPLPGSRLESVYLGPRSYPRVAVGNLVPEIDQIVVGTYLVPYVDPFTDARRAARVRRISLALYRPMHADPEFRALGSVMEFAYEDADSGHLFAYAPPHAAGERLPVLLFLHGSAGNFGAYFYLLRRLADASRVVLVCPSFGFGNWNEPGGVEAIERARRYAIEALAGDPERVVLAGLSNGGRGVTRAAAHAPHAYASFVFFSAVMEPSVYRQAAFARAVRGKPVLVVHGADDERIALAHAARAAGTFRAEGAHVTYRVVPGEDHFLLFSQPDRVLAETARFLASSRVGRAPPRSGPSATAHVERTR